MLERKANEKTPINVSAFCFSEFNSLLGLFLLLLFDYDFFVILSAEQHDLSFRAMPAESYFLVYNQEAVIPPDLVVIKNPAMKAKKAAQYFVITHFTLLRDYLPMPL